MLCTRTRKARSYTPTWAAAALSAPRPKAPPLRGALALAVPARGKEIYPAKRLASHSWPTSWEFWLSPTTLHSTGALGTAASFVFVGLIVVPAAVLNSRDRKRQVRRGSPPRTLAHPVALASPVGTREASAAVSGLAAEVDVLVVTVPAVLPGAVW